jgi:hypothetical protein
VFESIVVRHTRRGNWRGILINDELMEIQRELKLGVEVSYYLALRTGRGCQAKVLRAFCIGDGNSSFAFQ